MWCLREPLQLGWSHPQLHAGHHSVPGSVWLQLCQGEGSCPCARSCSTTGCRWTGLRGAGPRAAGSWGPGREGVTSTLTPCGCPLPQQRPLWLQLLGSFHQRPRDGARVRGLPRAPLPKVWAIPSRRPYTTQLGLRPCRDDPLNPKSAQIPPPAPTKLRRLQRPQQHQQLQGQDFISGLTSTCKTEAFKGIILILVFPAEDPLLAPQVTGVDPPRGTRARAQRGQTGPSWHGPTHKYRQTR